MSRRISDEDVNALVDGELSMEESAVVMNDPEAARRIREMRLLSDEISLAYADVHDATFSRVERPRLRAAAVVLLLLAGTLLGYFIRDLVLVPPSPLLVHIVDGSDAAMTAAVGLVERNLAEGLTVQLVAQRSGIALVRADSPHAARLQQLALEDDRFSVFACAGTMEKLRIIGTVPALIPAANTRMYAVDKLTHAIENHWRYERI